MKPSSLTVQLQQLFHLISWSRQTDFKTDKGNVQLINNLHLNVDLTSELAGAFSSNLASALQF